MADRLPAGRQGYGAFSVSGSKIEVVRRYIENQRKHHDYQTCQEEIELFVKEYDIIEYGPNFFWD